MALLVLGGCETSTVQSPFAARPDVDAASAPEADSDVVTDLLIADDEGPEDDARDINLGGRCVDAEQCDDGIDCTFDECDIELERCRFTPDDSQCQDESYCNGRELCRAGVGCRAGEPVSCDDQLACTIDRCIEETRECERSIRDTDQDGDPDAHCIASGGDCNDQDSRISSLRAEICDNRRDDDCDGEADEQDCERPEFDTCDAALAITAAASLRVSLEAAQPDSSSSCSTPDSPDIVLSVEAEEASDVTLTVRGADPTFSASVRSSCDSDAAEIACEPAAEVSSGESILRLRLNDVDGQHYVFLHDSSNSELELSVEYSQPTVGSENETCDTAQELTAGEPVTAAVFGAQPDVESACGEGEGELLYYFELDEAEDVQVFAVPTDGRASIQLSLRDEDCSLLEDELACTRSSDVALFARALLPGRYYVSLSAAPATDVELLLITEEPSEAPTGEGCGNPRALELGRSVDVDLGIYADDEALQCHAGGKDAVLRLELDAPSDVLLKQRFTLGDQGALALLSAECDTEASLACATSDQSPVRAVAHNVAAGTYHVLTESTLGNPVELLAVTRPARPPIVVIGADSCENAQEVPAVGGYLTGNTTIATAEYTASCDVAVGGGAPEQMLRLELSEKSRVILDSLGSAYRTVVNLRQGPECPGKQVPGACAAAPDESGYIEAVLDPGVYFIQVDGFAGDYGQWVLEVFVWPAP